MNLAGDAGQRDLVMEMGRSRDGDGVDTLGKQLFEGLEGAAVSKPLHPGTVRG
jgi:hypothetical protein